MANIKGVIIIENMQDGGRCPLGRVEIQPTDGDGCIQIWDMDGDGEPQAIWLDKSGAAILRDYIGNWLASSEGE